MQASNGIYLFYNIKFKNTKSFNSKRIRKAYVTNALVSATGQIKICTCQFAVSGDGFCHSKIETRNDDAVRDCQFRFSHLGLYGLVEQDRTSY